MKRDLLAAKLKADWLDGRRIVTALVETNDLNPETPEIMALTARIRRLAINREFVFHFPRDSEATEEMMLLRTDSKRILAQIRKQVHQLIAQYQLQPVVGDWEINKFGRTGRDIIPPRFVEKRPAYADELEKLGWERPPEWTVGL